VRRESGLRSQNHAQVLAKQTPAGKIQATNTTGSWSKVEYQEAGETQRGIFAYQCLQDKYRFQTMHQYCYAPLPFPLKLNAEGDELGSGSAC
jgi:hypothetical protein